MSSSGNHRFAAPLVAILFLAGLTFVFGWLLDKQRNPNQSIQTRITNDGGAEVVLQRNRMGHYLAPGRINGGVVEFFLDTGATDVVIPGNIANQLGLKKGAAISALTANGTVQVYATRLDSVSLGNIEMANVTASINPAMQGEEILLGMSFLRHLELVQRDGQLRIRIPSDQ